MTVMRERGKSYGGLWPGQSMRGDASPAQLQLVEGGDLGDTDDKNSMGYRGGCATMADQGILANYRALERYAKASRCLEGKRIYDRGKSRGDTQRRWARTKEQPLHKSADGQENTRRKGFKRLITPGLVWRGQAYEGIGV